MAKKTRTPPPPRARQQGPRARQQGPRRRDTGPPLRPPRLNRQGLLAGIGIGAVVGVIVLVLALTRGGSSPNVAAVRKSMVAAGCTFRTYPSEGRGHVTSLNANVHYKTFPPTSGRHYYVPLRWNRYAQPLPPVGEVHNLEHGGIIVQYGSKVPGATVEKLVSFYDSSPNAMLLAPLPGLGGKIALTAWTRLATCTAYDEKAFTTFRNAFRGKGPEHYPLNTLTPGR